MKAMFTCLGFVLCAATLALSVQADPCFPCRPQAPDACGPGFYSANAFGALYGPSYCLRPPYPPYSGMPPGASQGAGGMPGEQGGGGPWGIAAFPTHPFARSPRDFFMVGDP